VETLRGFVALGVGFLFISGLVFRKPAVRRLLLVAFFFRAFLALFHNFVVALPDSQADALMFEHTARTWATGGWASLLEHWQSGALLYSWLLAFFYLLFGPSTLLAQAINVLLGTFVVYLVWRIGWELFDEQKARLAGWAACLFPTLNLYSAITMREAVFVFLVLLGSLFAVKWFKSRTIWAFFWCTFFWVLATGFHLGAWPLLWALGLWSLGFGLFLSLRTKRFSWQTIGELALVGAASAFIVLCRWGWDKGGVFEVGVGTIQKVYAIGRAAYLKNLVADSLADLFWQAPIRVFFFLFTPFPWMVKEPIDLMGLFDAVLYVAITLATVWSLWQLLRTQPRKLGITIFFLSLAAIGILAFSIITSNYGAAIRHRAKFVPFLLIASVPALSLIVQKGRNLWARDASSLS